MIALAYARKSTDHQSADSIAAQLRAIRDYAARKSKKTCRNPDIRKGLIEEFTFDLLEREFCSNLLLLCDKVHEYHVKSAGEKQVKRIALEKEITRLEAQKIRLIDAVKNGMVMQSVIADELNALHTKIVALRGDVANLPQWRAISREKIMDFLKLQEKIIKDRASLQKLVAAYVERVIIYYDRVEVRLRLPNVYNGGGGGAYRQLYTFEISEVIPGLRRAL